MPINTEQLAPQIITRNVQKAQRRQEAYRDLLMWVSRYVHYFVKMFGVYWFPVKLWTNASVQRSAMSCIQLPLNFLSFNIVAVNKRLIKLVLKYSYISAVESDLSTSFFICISAKHKLQCLDYVILLSSRVPFCLCLSKNHRTLDDNLTLDLICL